MTWIKDLGSLVEVVGPLIGNESEREDAQNVLDSLDRKVQIAQAEAEQARAEAEIKEKQSSKILQYALLAGGLGTAGYFAYKYLD